MNEGAPERQLVRRVNRIMAGLAAIGVIAAGLSWGIAGAIGFAAGAAVSFLSFRWMANLVFAIDPAAGAPKRTTMVLLTLRYLLFAAAGYVIFRYSEIGFLAALAGCCIQIAAVILEVIYELVYAGTP
jgi:hypothetical protein